MLSRNRSTADFLADASSSSSSSSSSSISWPPSSSSSSSSWYPSSSSPPSYDRPWIDSWESRMRPRICSWSFGEHGLAEKLNRVEIEKFSNWTRFHEEFDVDVCRFVVGKLVWTIVLRKVSTRREPFSFFPRLSLFFFLSLFTLPRVRFVSRSLSQLSPSPGFTRFKRVRLRFKLTSNSRFKGNEDRCCIEYPSLLDIFRETVRDKNKKGKKQDRY